MEWIRVLVLSGEGGCILLEGRQDVRGTWFFRFRSDESLMEDLCPLEDAKVPAPTTETVKGLDAALEKLGERYKNWTHFYPDILYPQFAAQICRTALSRSVCPSYQWEEIAERLYFMSRPIATSQDFEQALLGLHKDDVLTDSHIRMLTAQCRALNSTITATLLAKAAGYTGYGIANINYGKLAHLVADRLGYSPPNGPKGRPLYWTTLSFSESKVSGEFRFIMRPELAKALKSSGLVKPLQNRVLPTGEIVASNSLGALMGNRGASAKLHSGNKELTWQHRPSQVDWKFCTLKAKNHSGNNIHRELMSGKSYTELFFLDEATAFSAGHRPCTCLGKKHSEFINRWISKNRKKCNCIREIDMIISEERIDCNGNKITFVEMVDELPDGTMVE